MNRKWGTERSLVSAHRSPPHCGLGGRQTRTSQCWLEKKKVIDWHVGLAGWQVGGVTAFAVFFSFTLLKLPKQSTISFARNSTEGEKAKNCGRHVYTYACLYTCLRTSPHMPVYTYAHTHLHTCLIIHMLTHTYAFWSTKPGFAPLLISWNSIRKTFGPEEIPTWYVAL